MGFDPNFTYIYLSNLKSLLEVQIVVLIYT
jgi:hypothetical protein